MPPAIRAARSACRWRLPVNTPLPRSIPSTARLFVEALQNWLRHQGRFWAIALPGALFLAALPVFIFERWLPATSPWVQTGIRAFVDAVVLYQWFKYALYEDWPERRALFLRQDGFPWGVFVSLGFIGFWAVHLLISYVVLSAGGQVLMNMMMAQYASTGGIGRATWGAQAALVPLKEIVLAILFGGFMLFLPARATALRWDPITAFRSAAGMRVRLIVVTVLWAFLTLVADRIVDTLTASIEPAGASQGALLAIDYASGVLAVAVDFLAYWVLAQVVTRLFVAKTGWTPEALPASRASAAAA